MKTKILSCVMAIVLCTCLSVTAFAAGPNNDAVATTTSNPAPEVSPSVESAEPEETTSLNKNVDTSSEVDKANLPIEETEEPGEETITTGPSTNVDENDIMIINKETGEKIEINSEDLSDFCSYICVMSAVYVGLIIILVIVVVGFAFSLKKKKQKEAEIIIDDTKDE